MAWRNQEATLVDRYSTNSTYFKKLGNIFYQGLVHPRPYRIVRIALAALFIYGGVIKLVNSKGHGWHRGVCALSLLIPAGPGISPKSIEGGMP
jgi:hypothetical protein